MQLHKVPWYEQSSAIYAYLTTKELGEEIRAQLLARGLTSEEIRGLNYDVNHIWVNWAKERCTVEITGDENRQRMIELGLIGTPTRCEACGQNIQNQRAA